MNNKGFTLVELVVMIAVLAMLSIVSFVSINEITKDSKINDCNALVSNIKNAAKEYVSDNRYTFTSTSNITIYASDLISSKYLKDPIYNPFKPAEVLDNSVIKIKITLNADYTAKDVTIQAPSVLKDCESGI